MAGAVIWLMAGTIATVLFTFGIGSGSPLIASLLYGLDAFGYRLAVGSLVVLGVLALLRWTQRADNRSLGLAGSPRAEGPGRGLELVFRSVVVAGLVVWTVSSLATEGFFRLEFGPLGESPRPTAVVAQLVSTMAFRTWVAGFVLLILRRLPLGRTVPTESQDSEG